MALRRRFRENDRDDRGHRASARVKQPAMHSKSAQPRCNSEASNSFYSTVAEAEKLFLKTNTERIRIKGAIVSDVTSRQVANEFRESKFVFTFCRLVLEFLLIKKIH